MPDLLTGANSGTLLLIDDDVVSREVMATLLTMKGYTVQAAGLGEEAVAMLESGSFTPQGILVDLRMSGLSGAELIARLRTKTHATIVAMSASEPQSEMIAQADGFLRKPFTPEELAAALTRRSGWSAPRLEAQETVVLDLKILAQLRETMPEKSVRALYAAAMLDLNERLGALEGAIARGDGAAVRLIGHNIKGGCGMAGAMEAAYLGAQLETESDKLDNSGAIVLRLRDAMEHLKYMLDAEFKVAQDDPNA
jgi:CheY-like chemotaxis protein